VGKKLLFIFFIFTVFHLNAQEYIFGNVRSEENAELEDVGVINLRTDEWAQTNREGHFMIAGKDGDKFRIFKNGYERAEFTANAQNIASAVNIILIRNTQLIEEVELSKSFTGNLKSDSKLLNRPKKVEQLMMDLGGYMSKKSTAGVMAAKAGEFVQPLGPGFPIGKVRNQWDDVDLSIYLQKALGDEYFYDLKIEKSQIQHFIFFVLQGFERQKILKYAYVDGPDMQRFQQAILTKIEKYKSQR
jgi:hypothetical protein